MDDAMNALTRLCHMAIEHKEAVTRRKKEALEEKRLLLNKMDKYLRDYDVWRTELKSQMDEATRALKVGVFRTDCRCHYVCLSLFKKETRTYNHNLIYV